MSHYSEKKDLFPMTGGCACGHVRYELALPPILVHCCSCLRCQRETGSILQLNAITEPSHVRLLPPGAPPGSGGLMPAFARLTGSQPTTATTTTTTERPAEPLLVAVPSASGAGQCIARCPLCFTMLWSHYADAGRVISYVRVGTLDRASEVDPDVHIYTQSRRRFMTIGDGKPQFDEYYPDRKELCRPDVLGRLEALEAKQAEFQAAFASAMEDSK